LAIGCIARGGISRKGYVLDCERSSVLCAFFAGTLLAADFFAAQKAFILSACCFRCAVVKVRFFLTGAAAAVTLSTAGAEATGFFGGRPRRLVGPCRTSMARLSRSRSAMRRATISSVCIHGDISMSELETIQSYLFNLWAHKGEAVAAYYFELGFRLAKVTLAVMSLRHLNRYQVF
jgi:hypothetical protein